MTALLVIIYVAFISLGLPDSILGSAWPVLQADLCAPFSLAGYIAMTVSAGTIFSSLLSNRLISRFGTGRVTAVSVLMTAAALLGYSTAPNLWMLFLFAVPLGLGAGSVDAALNNFIALHYEARHMNWLHCFWGVGATAGPMIMAFQISEGSGWRTGYLILSLIQFTLTALLFFTLPLWKKAKSAKGDERAQEAYISNRQALRIPGILLALTAFLFFCATESTTGLWGASYLNAARGVSPADAAIASSLFYGAITVGRLLSGFLSAKIPSPLLIRIGQLVCMVGTVCIILPLPAWAAIGGITLIGLGTAPIFPSMLHETPNRFGADNSQAVVGLQMASAYLGSTLFPPLFGSLASVFSTALYPYFLLYCILVMFLCSELVQRRTRGAKQTA